MEKKMQNLRNEIDIKVEHNDKDNWKCTSEPSLCRVKYLAII